MNEVQNPFAIATRKQESSGALAVSDQARGIAEVQAKLLMAQQFPRNQVQAMDDILNAFTRPKLAEVAKYQYSRGGTDIDGPSIRAAETIAQNWGNIEFGFREVARGRGPDGVTYSEVEAFAFDLQKRTRRNLQFQVRHWRDTRKGGYAITDERDIYEMISNMAQRRVRACILAVVPGDVVDSAMEQAEVTLKATADTSPEAMQKLLSAFEPFGVTKEHIEARIQRRIDSIQPAQVVSLRKIYASLRDGMSKAADWFEVEEQDVGGATTLQDIKAKAAKNTPRSEAKAEAGKPAQGAESSAPADSGADYATLLSRIQHCADIEVLDLIGDDLRTLPEGNERVKLEAAYAERREALGQQ